MTNRAAQPTKLYLCDINQFFFFHVACYCSVSSPSTFSIVFGNFRERRKKRIMSVSPIEVVLYIQFGFAYLHLFTKHSFLNHKNAESTIPQIDSYEFYAIPSINSEQIPSPGREHCVAPKYTRSFALTRTQQQ